MSARDEILARIQRSFPPTARNSAEDHASIPRDYVQSGSLDPESRLDLFEDRLRDYGTEVYRCVPAQLPETIALAMRTAGIDQLLVAEDVPPSALPAHGSGGRSFGSDLKEVSEKGAFAPDANSAPLSFVQDENLSYEDLDRSQGVLTGCAVAIALTGTIIIRHLHGISRALTLIPDYHLCIVRASHVVETVPEAIRSIEDPARAPITTISGPSATSDIEMTRIQGVHGPRRLAVILVLA
ncbi:MAG TPA: LUD domain-containing protein [Candidatus Aquilonibacter sp.]|nr:LUD domain-containing protein [Candidatus Aquilonibacter sp.]